MFEHEVHDEIAQRIHGRRGSGEPLEDGLRTNMESQFGASFADVRLHHDKTSDDLNRSLNAEAFTTGSDIFFRSGRYDPTSGSGQNLIAHELTHVLQQRGAPTTGPMKLSDPDDASEREAHRVADALDLGPSAKPASGSSSVARQATPPVEELDEDEIGSTLARQVADEEDIDETLT